MESCKYCIIGGGPAGIGFLSRIIESGEKDVRLFEGRDEILYSLSFMPSVKIKSEMFPGPFSGKEFRDHLLKDDKTVPFVTTGSRLIGLDADKKICTVNIEGKENREIRYTYLIIATGAIQAIYGKELLPGYRGAGIFTAYQVSEMLTHYDFLPGKRLAVIGDSGFAEETVYLAEKAGIKTTLLSKENLPGAVRYESILGLLGDEHISGIKITGADGKTETIEIDSLAVDGLFSMEHKMRELLEVEWDIENWKADTDESWNPADRPDIFLTGDALKPDFSFLNQYENGYNLAGRIA